MSALGYVRMGRLSRAAQGIVTLVNEIRKSPIEPGMPVPSILVVCLPPVQSPRGVLAAKFSGAEQRCTGLSDAYRGLLRY